MALNKRCGVYKITNKINKKVYIGSSKNIPKRFSTHRSELRKNKHANVHLQNSWNIHGEQSFIFEILFNCKDEDKIKKETEEIRKYIKKFNEKNLYNIILNPYQQAINYEIKSKIKDGFKSCRECGCLFKISVGTHEIYFDGYYDAVGIEEFDIEVTEDDLCLNCSSGLFYDMRAREKQLYYEELDEHYQEEGLGEYTLAYLDENIIQDMKLSGSWED